MIMTYSKKKDGAKALSENFKVQEFACPGTDEIRVDTRLVEILQALRDYFGRPVIIGSGYRTPEYNKQIGGAINSDHNTGKAADIDVGKGLEEVSPSLVCMYLQAVGVQRIGRYILTDGGNWIHVGSEATPRFWAQSVRNGPLSVVKTFLPTLRRGYFLYSNRYEVKILQTMLGKILGVRVLIDGKFGPATQAILKMYQKQNGLKVDGICGPITWGSLFKHKITWG